MGSCCRKTQPSAPVKARFRQNTSYEQPVCPRPHWDSTNITRARHCSWVINSWFYQAQNAQQNQFLPRDKFVKEPFLDCKKSLHYFWSEHRNVGLSRFRICGLFSTFPFPVLCKLLHFWCLPRMPFLILGLVVLHIACKITPRWLTDYLWLLVTKWLQFGGTGQNMKSDYSKTPFSSLPVRPTPSPRHSPWIQDPGFRTHYLHQFLSLSKNHVWPGLEVCSRPETFDKGPWHGSHITEDVKMSEQIKKTNSPKDKTWFLEIILLRVGWQYTEFNKTFGIGI